MGFGDLKSRTVTIDKQFKCQKDDTVLLTGPVTSAAAEFLSAYLT